MHSTSIRAYWTISGSIIFHIKNKITETAHHQAVITVGYTKSKHPSQKNFTVWLGSKTIDSWNPHFFWIYHFYQIISNHLHHLWKRLSCSQWPNFLWTSYYCLLISLKTGEQSHKKKNFVMYALKIMCIWEPVKLKTESELLLKERTASGHLNTAESQITRLMYQKTDNEKNWLKFALLERHTILATV